MNQVFKAETVPFWGGDLERNPDLENCPCVFGGLLLHRFLKVPEDNFFLIPKNSQPRYPGPWTLHS